MPLHSLPENVKDMYHICEMMKELSNFDIGSCVIL